MKTTLLTLAFAFLTFTGVMAQQANVNKADKAFKEGNIAEAKEFIDLAMNDAKTATAARTLYTRAQIYQAIATDTEGLFDERTKAEAMKVALGLYEGLLASEKENSTFHIMADQGKQSFYGFFFNEAAEFFNDGEYADAVSMFKSALQILPNDTTALLYGGFAAQSADDWAFAETSFNRLVNEFNTQDKGVYQSLIYIYRAINKNGDKALEMINKARRIFPADADFARELVSVYIELNRVDEALSVMEAQVKAEPDNETYHLNIGIIYDQKGDKEKAIAAYTRALELNPNMFDGNFNLGAIYYNEGAEVMQEANKMDLDEYQKKGKEIEAKAKAQFEKALPFMEKAHAANKEDLQTIQTLITIYTQLGNTAKAQEFTAKLNAMMGDDN